MDPNLPKWVQASLCLIMKAVADDESVEFFSEGVDEETPKAFQRNSILLRINGPSILRSQSDSYSIQVQVVVTDLVTPKKNSYEHFQRVGAIASKLEESLPINRHGDGGTLVGCLSPERGSREVVKIVHFGQVDDAVKVRQSAVLANFELHL
jgi:hypothetical protein